MRKSNQRSKIRYVKSDYVPGTDVLAVDRKDTGFPLAATPPNPDPAIVRDSKSGNVIAEYEVTDQSGPAPEALSAVVP